MKTILCYGDSLTWGYDPATGNRIAMDKRWTQVLKHDLGNDYIIIEEGLNGRTTVWDDPLHGGYKNCMKYLIPCLDSHRPIYLVILFLCTNDLKMRFSLSAAEIAQGIRVLVNIILKSESEPEGSVTKFLLVSPPHIKELSNFTEESKGRKPKSRQLSYHYKQVAEEYGCNFLDSSKVVVTSDIDGIHLDDGEHVKLVYEISKIIGKIL